MIFCSSCGTQNPDGATFCTKCGKAISMQTAQPVIQTQYIPVQGTGKAPKKRSLFSISLFILFLVALICVVGFIIWVLVDPDYELWADSDAAIQILAFQAAKIFAG